MTASPTAELKGLLDDEKVALLAGDYEKLTQIAARKQTCMTRLAAAAPSAATLRDLKARLQTNQDLTASALRGVQAAKARWAELEKVRDGLTTYDLSGKVAVVPTQQSRVQKKA